MKFAAPFSLCFNLKVCATNNWQLATATSDWQLQLETATATVTRNYKWQLQLQVGPAHLMRRDVFCVKMK